MVTIAATAEGTAQQSIPFGDAAETLRKTSSTEKDWEPPTPDSVLVPVHHHDNNKLENRELGLTLKSPENANRGDEFVWLPPPALNQVQHPSTEEYDRTSLKLISIARPGSLRRGGGGNNSNQVRTRGEGGNDYGVRGNEGEERVAIEITRATPSTVNLINRHLAAQEYQEGVDSNLRKATMEQPQRGFFTDNPASPSMDDGASVIKSRKARPALELQYDAKIAVLTPLFPLPTPPLQSAHRRDDTSARSLSVKNTLCSTEANDGISTQTTNETVRKRPRREAAIASAKRTSLAARQPSPFELDELTLASPSLSPGLGSSLSSSSGRRQLDTGRQVLNGSGYHPLPSRRGSTKNTKTSCAGGGGGGGGTLGSQSNRKVSHSLIERRRREKINDCLTTLRAIVPQCREEGEKKFARAKERGRKRGGNGAKKLSWQSHDGNVDGMDAVQDGDEEVGFGSGCSRGGLHKLEILQGTILYIEELEARLDVFETAASRSGSSSSSLSALQAAASSANTNEEFQDPHFTKEEEADLLIEEEEGFGKVESHGPEVGDAPVRRHRLMNEDKVMQLDEEAEQLAVDDVDTAAGLLLLKFSTSPELRPVYS